MRNLTVVAVPGTNSPDLAAHLHHYIGVLKRGWPMIGISVVFCLTLASIYLAATKRLYAATAQLLVLQQGGRPLSVTQDDPLRDLERAEDFIPTQMAVLQSPRVVGRAIEAVGVKNLPTLLAKQRTGSKQELIQIAIEKCLKVTRPDRTAMIIKVEYRAGSPDEAVRMVEALIKSYEDYLAEHFQSSNIKVVSLISQARDELSRELAALEEKYLEFQRHNPLLVDEPGGISGDSLIKSRLVELDRAANEATVKALRLKSQLELGRELAKEGADTWAVAYAISQLEGDRGSQGVNLIPNSTEALQSISSDYVRQLIKEQQELAQEYGPEYSRVKELQKEIAAVQARAHDATSRLDQEGVKQLLLSVERSLASIEAMRAGIAAQFQGDVDRVKEDLMNRNVGRNLRDDLERQKALFNTVVDQLKQAQLSGDYSSIISQTLEPANALDKPVQPRMGLTLALALMVGCTLGVGAALVADGLDARIRSIEELREALGLNVLGLIPKLSGDQIATAGAADLISHVLPRSLPAEAYKACRTNLEFLRRDRLTQVILVTSPLVGDGKSTTSSNLAICLALAGRKVLLIDADLRKPTLHTAHRLRRDTGLADILKNPLPLRRVVQQTTVDNLDVVTAGPEVPDPAELLMSPHLREFLHEARIHYDVVIVDSSPLLLVTDAAVIGALADGVVLVIRASTIKRPVAARAVESLRALGTPILGAVVNEFTPEQVGYGYGYGYGTYGSPSPRSTEDGARGPGAGPVDSVTSGGPVARGACRTPHPNGASH